METPGNAACGKGAPSTSYSESEDFAGLQAEGGLKGTLRLEPLNSQEVSFRTIQAVQALFQRQSSETSEEQSFWYLDMMSDATVSRFLFAEKGDASKACKRLLATWKWRKKNQPWAVKCHLCISDHRTHDFRYLCHDQYSRPVLYLSFATFHNPESNLLMDHVIAQIEQCTALYLEGSGGGAGDGQASTFVWVADYTGFGLRHPGLNPRFPLSLAYTFQTHYPERLGAVLCVDAPSIFEGVWNVIQPALDAKTRSKIHFVRGAQGRSEMANELFGPARSNLAYWLVDHMNKVRQPDYRERFWQDPHEMPPAE